MCRSSSHPRRKDSLRSSVEKLDRHLSTSRQIAMKRMHCLGVSIAESPSTQLWEQFEICGDVIHGGLAALLVSLLNEAFQYWSIFYETIAVGSCSQEKSATTPTICHSDEVEILQRTVRLLSNVSQLDPTLGEEIGRAGSQSICTLLLKQINRYTTTIGEERISEEDSDALVELQDSVFEIYSPSSAARSMPFEQDVLHSRLPLVYNLTSTSQCGETSSSKVDDAAADATIFINQVTKRQSAQADVGFVMWPSAIVLSRWLMSNPRAIQSKSVLELGAGCGLVGIAAARIIARYQFQQQHEQRQTINAERKGEVIITDVNELVLENISQNIRLNDVASLASVAKLDFYSQSGRNSGTWLAGERRGVAESEREPVDVILAADIICQPSDAVAASKTIKDALRPEGVAYVVCATAQHRYGVEIFGNECKERGLDVTARNVAEIYENHGEGMLLEEMQTAAGYVEGMELTFFEIHKG